MRIFNKTLPLLPILFWLLVWQVVSLRVDQTVLLPSPLTVLAALTALLGQEGFWQSIFFSLSRILSGFLLATVFGSILGAASGYHRLLRVLLAPLVRLAKAVPVASFVILALVWVPSRNLSVLISFLMVFPLMYTNLAQGIRELDGSLAEMGQVFAVPAARRIRLLILPQLLPYFLSAATVGLGLCWKAGVAAELIGLPDGSLGERLYEAKAYYQIPDLFAWTAVIVLLSICVEKLILRATAGAVRRYGR